MPYYKFIPTDTDYMEFTIEAASLDEAPDALEFELQMHDEFKVIPQPDGIPAVDVFLKDHHIDTLTISELNPEDTK